MPIDDYDREKTLQATSFNDSGATVDKAQPVILRGNDFTGVDGFESGSSQLGWEGDLGVSINSNNEVFLNNSLQISSSNAFRSSERFFLPAISSDSKRITTSLKIDKQTGNQNDSVAIILKNSNDLIVVELKFLGNGDVENSSGVISSWSAGEIIDVELVLDFSNNQYDTVINGSTVSSNQPFFSNRSASQIDSLKLENDTTGSGSTVNAFFDRLTYTSPPEDSVNAGGFIGYDSSTVTDAQDVGFYDQNDNLLDYEIENGGDLGSSSAEVVAWVYRDYVRDDSDQVKFAFGNNSASTDRQNVTGTWNHTGQNTERAYHFSETSSGILDSTTNTQVGSVTGATRGVDGFIGKAYSFDGNDDFVDTGSNFNVSGDGTVLTWFKVDGSSGWPDSNSSMRWFANFDGSNSLENVFPDSDQGVGDSSNDFTLGSFDGSAHRAITDGDKFDAGTNHTLATTYTGSTWKNFIDGVDETDNTKGTGTGYVSTTVAPYIGAQNVQGSDKIHFSGEISDIRVYSDSKDDAWMQADFDASPKAGQVFFTQAAAQDTAGALTATVTDSFDLTEDTSFLLKFTASDNLTVQENEEGTLSDLLDDNVTFNEQVKSRLLDSLTDQLGFAEETTRTIFQDVTDQLGFSEDINATLALTVLVSDSLQFAENIDSELRDALRDDIDLNENVESRLIDSLADQIGFTEFVQPAIAQLLQDDLGFNEAAATQIQDQITEQLSLSENIESQLNDILSRQLDFTEETAEALASNFTDQLQFQEEVINIVDETLRDDIGFSEEVSSLITRQLSDQLSFQDQVLFASLLNIEGLTEAIIKKPNRFVTMQNRTFKQGDLGDELQATLRDKNGKIDLSQISSVDFVARDTKKNKVLDEQVTISDPANGVIQYQWRQGDFIEDAGVYQAEFRINDNAGNTETVPNDGYVTIEIEEEIQ